MVLKAWCVLGVLLATGLASEAADPVPEMVVQMGHGDVVRTAAVSRDGNYLASGSLDGTAMLWDVATGRLIRVFPGHKGGTLSVAFGADGGHLITGGADGTVRIWSLESGERVRSFVAGREPVTSLAEDTRKGRLAAGCEDGRIRIWDLASGELLADLPGHAHGVSGLAFTAGGRLVSGGADGLVKVRLAAADSAAVQLAGHDGPVTCVASGADTGLVASGGEDGTVRLWDIAKGTLVWTAEGHEQPVQSVAFTADGRSVISGGWDGVLRVWDIASGKTTAALPTGETVGTVVVGPHGGIALSGGGDNRLTLWSEDGKPVRRFEGPGTWVYAVAVGGPYMATGSADGRVRVWDLTEGRLLRTIDAHTAAVASVALSADGTVLISGGGDGRVRVWDALSGDMRHDFGEHEAWVYSVAVTPDGRTAVSGSADETAIVWDLSSGKAVSTLEGHSGEVTAVAITDDGSRVVSAGGDGVIHTWDAATGNDRTQFNGHEEWIFGLDITSDGTRAASASEDGSVMVLDLTSGVEVKRVDVDAPVTSVALSADGRRVLAGTMDGSVMEVVADAGIITWMADGHSRRVSSVAFSTGGDKAFSGSWDGTVRVWNRTGAELVSLIGFSTGDWLATTPDGHFNCSIDGSRYIGWRVGLQVFPFERYEEVYRDRLVIPKRLGIQSSELPPEAPPAPESAGRPPKVALSKPQPGLTTEAETVDITVDAQDTAGVAAIKVTVNGRPLLLKGEARIALPPSKEQARSVVIQVPLVHGPNRIAVTAVNPAGLQSDPDTVTVHKKVPGPEPPKGDMWILVVGVSEHSNPRYSLRYPSVDATALAAALKEKADPLYGDVHVRALTDKDSTTPKIKEALGEIASQTGPEDVVTVFVAGHGVRTKQGEYYFITHDGNPAHLKETAFSWRAFEDLLRTMPARSVLLFADTCHSGDIVRPGSRFAGSEEMSENLVKKSGVVVFVSSQGCEYSLESEAWGHGAFTYALLEALGGQANYQKDRVITMAELQLYVPTRVRTITNNKQHPRIPRLDNFDPEMPLVSAQ